MNYQAQIQYTLSADGPILVSSGGGNKLHTELPDNTFLTGMADGVETFVIPGSTLKGVIRHYFYQTISQNETSALLGNEPKEKPYTKSKVAFSDAYVEMPSVKMTTRYSTALGGISQSAKHGSLNNMQTMIKGDFSGNIKLREVTYKELLTVLDALRAIDSGEIRIGGKRSRGFGKMKISCCKIIICSGYDDQLRPIKVGTFDSVTNAITGIRAGCLKEAK